MCSTPDCVSWKDAASAKITSPCCTARTRRVVNDRPSRIRSTSKMIGASGSPGRTKYACSECTDPVRVHGPPGRDQRLARDLAAEHPRGAVRRAEPAEQVHLEPLEVEQRDEVVQGVLAGHDRSLGAPCGVGLLCDPGRRHRTILAGRGGRRRP